MFVVVVVYFGCCLFKIVFFVCFLLCGFLWGVGFVGFFLKLIHLFLIIIR